MFDEKELDATSIQVPRDTLAFLRSIDRPETVLMLFDLYAYGFAGVTGVQMALLARFLARETRFMTLRGGGHHFHLMEQVLKYCTANEPTGRFELFLTRHQCSFVECQDKAKVHVFQEGEIPRNSTIAQTAMELDFQRDREGRTFAEWVFRGEEASFREKGKERVDNFELEYRQGQGAWTVSDALAVLGWGNIRRATHILHMGGVFGAYEGELMRHAGVPAFNALGMEYPLNVAYRDLDTEISRMKGTAAVSYPGLPGKPSLTEYDQKGTWFEFKKEETGLAVSLSIDPYFHYPPDDGEEADDRDEESIGFPREVAKNAILCHGFTTWPEEDGSFEDGLFCDTEVLAADIKELHRLFRKLQAREIKFWGPFPERDAWGYVPPFCFLVRREEDGARMRLLLRGLAMIQTRHDFHVSEERLSELCDYFGQITQWFPPLEFGETRTSRWAPYREEEERE